MPALGTFGQRSIRLLIPRLGTPLMVTTQTAILGVSRGELRESQMVALYSARPALFRAWEAVMVVQLSGSGLIVILVALVAETEPECH